MGTEFKLKSINSSTKSGCTFSPFLAVFLSLSLSHAYTQTNTHSRTHLRMFYASTFQIDSLHSHYLPWSICRDKIKRSLCCVSVVVRVSEALYHSIVSQIRAAQCHFYNQGKGQASTNQSHLLIYSVVGIGGLK